MAYNYWLFKSDPDNFCWQDFQNASQQTTCWDGVRNYQARNYLRDCVKLGDQILFYHSVQASPAVVGTADVVKSAYPDETQFDPASKYYDPKATKQQPRWLMVDIQLKCSFHQPVTLAEIRQQPLLADMGLVKKGNRLSIQPVTPAEFALIVQMGQAILR